MLRWMLAWGEHVEFLEKLAARGKRVEAIENRPELWVHLAIYFHAFLRLHNRRSISDTGYPLPIPDDVIERYAVREGIEDLRLFVEFVEALDNAFITFVVEKRKAAEEPSEDGKVNIQGGNTTRKN